MTNVRTFALLTAALGLSACAVAETPTRNAPVEPTARAIQTDPAQQTIADLVRIKNVVVDVPTWLTVSEANRYLPSGDIVWRGDPIGDRRAQVKTIMEDGFERGAKSTNGPKSVNLLVSVRRFHALTEKARYTTGGVHHIVFVMALADARTGELVMPWRTVQADLQAYGGQKAIEADARGETQKVRITDHLSKVLIDELSTTEGFQNPELGLIQALNEI